MGIGYLWVNDGDNGGMKKANCFLYDNVYIREHRRYAFLYFWGTQ